VDDEVYSQPLVYSNLAVGTGNLNAVIIATMNNTVYHLMGIMEICIEKKTLMFQACAHLMLVMRPRAGATLILISP
jgi:hypothetical protein